MTLRFDLISQIKKRRLQLGLKQQDMYFGYSLILSYMRVGWDSGKIPQKLV